MILTLAGLLLWIGAHLFKRLAPEARARLGETGKGIVAVTVVASVVMMTLGYRDWFGPVWWGPSAALTGINNILVLAGFYLFAASGAKVAVTRHIRHPQLTGFSLWAGAHVLVNGDLPSLVLFGGLLAWALAEIALINRAQPNWTPPPPAGRAKEIRAIAATIIVFAVVSAIHGWVGPWPFG